MFFSNSVTASLGKEKRINRLFQNGKSVFIPLDDSLISGPTDGLLDLQTKIEDICKAHPSAVLGFSGSLSIANKIFPNIPSILNLTASTTLSEHTNKVLISSVEQSIAIGADAVGVHINLSSKYESNMLESLGKISSDCNIYGIPLMVLSYPRKEIYNKGKYLKDYNYEDIKKTDPERYAELVSHCVRIAYEMGADIIKTQYTGSKNTFEKVIKSAHDTPVIIAGGNMMDYCSLFSMCRDAIDVGAKGVCIGRNVFNRKNSQSIILALKKLVFDDETVTDVIEYITELERSQTK